MHQITLTVSKNVLLNHINEHSGHVQSVHQQHACTRDLKRSRHWSIVASIMSEVKTTVFAGRRHLESFHTRIAV